MADTTTTRILTGEQQQIVDELVKSYRIEPEQILFYNNKPDPFFTYEAVCSLCNQLTDLEDISVEPVTSPFANSIAMKCTLVGEIGRRSATGMVNVEEKIDGVKMTEPQLLGLASSRALRNALKLANIDLLTAHQRVQQTGEITSLAEVQENKYRNDLLAEAHALGGEAGLIAYGNKSLWYNVIASRYDGIESSGDLTNEQLTDFIAFLRTLAPTKTALQPKKAA